MLKTGLYKHYKGNFYEVIGIAKHSETLEDLVVYKAKNNKDSLWVRPLCMFQEKVEAEGEMIERFHFIERV